MNKQELFSYIKDYSSIANKALGQNFLVDENVILKIVEALEIKKKDQILEIGAGLGSLSFFLSEKKSSLTLVDIDQRMSDFEKKLFANDKNVKVINRDILKVDLSKKNKIVGNLPYYLTSDILEYVLLNAIEATTMVFMVQKEAFNRLINPTTLETSPLSLLINYLFKKETILHVNKNAFIPRPKIDSTIFKLVRINSLNDEITSTYLLAKNLFKNKRKTILNNLALLLNNKEEASEILKASGYEIKTRPENLNFLDYLKINRILLINKQVIK